MRRLGNKVFSILKAAQLWSYGDLSLKGKKGIGRCREVRIFYDSSASPLTCFEFGVESRFGFP